MLTIQALEWIDYLSTRGKLALFCAVLFLTVAVGVSLA